MLEKDLPLFYLALNRYRTACRLEADGHLFTPNECAVILFLIHHPSVDISREIARLLGISTSLVSRSVDSLTQLGYLTATQDREDRRVWHLRLTENSRPLIEQVEKMEEKFQRDLIRGISDRDLQVARRVMRQMAANLQTDPTEKGGQ